MFNWHHFQPCDFCSGTGYLLINENNIDLSTLLDERKYCPICEGEGELKVYKKGKD